LLQVNKLDRYISLVARDTLTMTTNTFTIFLHCPTVWWLLASVGGY